MKKLLPIFVGFILATNLLHSQNVAINSTGALPATSAMLDIDMTGKGLLIPRMTTAQRPASPVTSLIIYNTSLARFEYWDGTAWVPFLSSSNGWSLSGNTLTGTLPASPNEWIGTINASDWIVKTTNSERMRIDASGNVGIGTGAPGTALHVFSSAATALQVKAEQTNTVTLSQFIAQGENSNAIIYMRQGNSGLAGTTYGNMPLSGSLVSGTSNTNGLILNSANATAPMVFVTGGSALANERMRIDANGNVGIGTPSPAYPLHVYNSQNAGMYSVFENPNTGALTTAGLVARSNAGSFGFQIGSTAYGGWSEIGTNANGGFYYDVVNAAGDHIWRTTATYIERMRITNAGNVGINQPVPTTKLDVAGGNGTTLKVTDGNQADRKVLTSDATGVASWAYPLGYTLQAGTGAAGTTPLDASTYYFGSIPDVLGITADISRVYMPRAGVIKACYVFFSNGGVLGSAETSSVYIRINNTTDVLVSGTVTNSTTTSAFSSSSLSQAVNAGDYFEIKWTTPSWITNPTSVKASAVVYIE